LKRTKVGEAPAGEPLVAVTVTEDEKVAGLGRGGRGSTTPPTLATYLPSPTFPSLLTTPCPRSLFSSLRENSPSHLGQAIRPLFFTPSACPLISPPTPCPRSPFFSLREFTLAPWTRHTSAILHPRLMSANFTPRLMSTNFTPHPLSKVSLLFL